MIRSLFFIGCIAIFFAPLAQAEIYQYRDSYGNLRFTDNYLEVPPEQRPDFDPPENLAQDIPTPQPEDVDNVSNPSGDEPSITDPEKEADAEPTPGLSIKDLQQKQTDLLKEYDALSADRERIEGLRESRKTQEEISQFNAEAMALSERIKAFNERKKELDEQLRGYNELIEEYNQQMKGENEPLEVDQEQVDSPQTN